VPQLIFACAYAADQVPRSTQMVAVEEKGAEWAEGVVHCYLLIVSVMVHRPVARIASVALLVVGEGCDGVVEEAEYETGTDSIVVFD